MVPSTNGKLGLHDLVEDVLILILTECDVADVLALSATNKYFHHLALTSAVWYPLVMKLVRRGFINSRPDDDNLKDLPTEQLIGLVKQMLRGPKSWTETYFETSPAEKTVRRAVNLFKKFVRKPRLASAPLVESRRILLYPMTSTGPGISHSYNKQKLLPGGKYVLFKNWIRFECWSVFEDKSIWTHDPSMGSVCVLEFNAELVEDDRIVIVACQRTWAQPEKHFAEITTLDMKTGVSNSEVVSRVPDYTGTRDNTYDCAVCGDIAAVYFLWSDEVLLINWRTKSRVLVLPDPSLIAIALAPGYLLLSLRHSRSKNRLAASPLASISSWEPNDSVEEPSAHTEVANLSIGVHNSIILAGGIPCSRLWVYESPLQWGRFKVLLHTSIDYRWSLCSYEFIKHEDGTRLSWRFLSSIRMPDRFMSPVGMTHSGHALSRFEIFPPGPVTKNSPRRTVEFPGRGLYVHLSSYGGALTYSTDKELVVVYYD